MAKTRPPLARVAAQGAATHVIAFAAVNEKTDTSKGQVGENQPKKGSIDPRWK